MNVHSINSTLHYFTNDNNYTKMASMSHDLSNPTWMYLSLLAFLAWLFVYGLTKKEQLPRLKFYLFLFVVSCMAAFALSQFTLAPVTWQIACALGVGIAGVVTQDWWIARGLSGEVERSFHKVKDVLSLTVIAALLAFSLVHSWNTDSLDYVDALVTIAFIFWILREVFQLVTGADTNTEIPGAPDLPPRYQAPGQEPSSIPSNCVEITHWQPDGSALVNYLGSSWRARLADSREKQTSGFFLVTRIEAGTLWLEPTFPPSDRLAT